MHVVQKSALQLCVQQRPQSAPSAGVSYLENRNMNNVHSCTLFTSFVHVFLDRLVGKIQCFLLRF